MEPPEVCHAENPHSDRIACGFHRSGSRGERARILQSTALPPGFSTAIPRPIRASRRLSTTEVPLLAMHCSFARLPNSAAGSNLRGTEVSSRQSVCMPGATRASNSRLGGIIGNRDPSPTTPSSFGTPVAARWPGHGSRCPAGVAAAAQCRTSGCAAAWVLSNQNPPLPWNANPIQSLISYRGTQTSRLTWATDLERHYS
jgi:hypothetical protein